MRKKIATIKRIIVFCLTIALIANTSIYVTASDGTTSSQEVVPPEMDLSGLEDNTSVTYNLETNEITYGADQNVCTAEEFEIEDDGISSHLIMGNDDRKIVTNTTDSPYRNVCQLTVTYSDGSVAVASGTLVYFNVLLTAGHVVYSHGHGWATRIDVTPGRKGRELPLGSTWATSMTTSNNWINDRNYDYDWAIVDLQNSFSTWQLYACYQNASVATGRSVQAIGYPSDASNNGYNYYMYEDTNVVTAATDLHFDGIYDMTPGESGGAIIDVKTGYLVGIISIEVRNSAGQNLCNRGVLMTDDLFQRIKAHSK